MFSYVQGTQIDRPDFQQGLAPQKWTGNLESVGNSKLSPRLSNFLSNIRVFEDHVNRWALSHVQIQLSIFLYSGVFSALQWSVYV